MEKFGGEISCLKLTIKEVTEKNKREDIQNISLVLKN